MTRLVKFAGSLAVAASMTLVPALASAAEDKDVIAYREHIMNTLQEQSFAISPILSTAIPDTNAVAHLEILALTASLALKAFEAKVPGGEAKPEVWAKWDDFSKRMKKFADDSAAAAKLGKEKGWSAASANILDVLQCKQCHEVYRDEKKK
jgi:cytochrome c556